MNSPSPSVSTPLSGAVPPEKKAKPNNRDFTDLLDEPEFADMSILVGGEEKEYKLHRVILSRASPFFKAICKVGTFIEGNERLIKLPEITPAVFDILIKWIYGGPFSLSDDIATTQFCRIHQGADFLGLQDLKAEMLDQLGARITEKQTQQKATPHLETAPPECKIFFGLSSSCSYSDWPALHELADKMIPYYGIGDETLTRLATSEKNNNLTNTVIIDIYKQLLDTNFCRSCQRDFAYESLARTRCRNCNSGIVKGKRVYSSRNGRSDEQTTTIP